MKDDVILKVENLSKQYRLGTIGTGTISHDLNRFIAKIRGKDDPFLKIGESNDRSKKGKSEYVWALKDINFEVKRGEVLGIIGKNGAGKSTLLKILSKVTGPTTGSIKSKGRIASLLEVGTGFHPEMTGKENIFLNGAILGMTKKEINSKLDEIVEFSGCERYIDTPVKRYSSGMKVRLAFAVAAFLEPDILVVDEVLAVGDAEFQKKAIGKMQDISNSDGRTVLFVSHNMASLQSLCSKAVVLENGEIQFTGNVKDSINHYLKQFTESLREVKYQLNNAPGNNFYKFTYAKVCERNKLLVDVIREGEEIEIQFEFYIKKQNQQQLGITFHLQDEMGTLVFVGSSCSELRIIDEGYYREKVVIPKNLMQEGIYSVTRLLLVLNSGTVVCETHNPIQFEILSKDNENFGWKGNKEGAVKPKLNWERLK
ncbi:lipopolysaccharide transport system ATP-binding protein [Lutibacter sp. Hel_I_33_5]|uniref:ABC transporter ATP-binding protein n=1 Tax=Lutibacter sp. Hel_I_33_5 TaxID=1566289 RepID=UPI0011A9AD4F|nr:ABC transporter ATP-binding protein [Lutibacter sp. Hel_I_33_5]TVZ54850.1 lipopolysaccharide transport system ATP-binding protein [Lutibacter sp. Hel_I_33_5]